MGRSKLECIKDKIMIARDSYQSDSETNQCLTCFPVTSWEADTAGLILRFCQIYILITES